MKTRQELTVYWLLPAKDERELFCDIIRILCKQFQAPSFEPHLTLLVATKGREAGANRRRKAVAPSPSNVLCQIESEPIRLHVRGISFSQQFAKTFFIRFESDKALGKLAGDLGRAVNGRAQSLRDPHVSLLYKRVPAAVKKELAKTIKLPFREVVFDSIAAVRAISPMETEADIKSWHVVASKKLSA